MQCFYYLELSKVFQIIIPIWVPIERCLQYMSTVKRWDYSLGPISNNYLFTDCIISVHKSNTELVTQIPVYITCRNGDGIIIFPYICLGLCIRSVNLPNTNLWWCNVLHLLHTIRLISIDKHAPPSLRNRHAAADGRHDVTCDGTLPC